MRQSFAAPQRLRPEPRPGTVLVHREAVETVLTRLRDHPEAPLRLDEMAELARMSRFHFNHRFRQITGLTPRQFQTALRLQASLRLLLGSRRSITDICFEVGYESLGSFITRFTTTFGVAPQRLRGLAPALAQPLGELLRSCGALRDRPDSAPGTSGPGGRIEADNFDGMIFVGLFAQRIPSAAPSSCVLLEGPGPFVLPAPREGRYYVMAAGLAPARPAVDLLLADDLPRSATPSPLPCRQGKNAELPTMKLRPPEKIDPPIQLVLPLLLRLNAGGK